VPSAKEAAVKPAQRPVAANQAPLDEATWADVLNELKKEYNTLYGIVRMAQLDFSEPGKVELGFSFAFHQKRVNDAKNRKIIGDCILQTTGQEVEIRCVVNKDAKPQAITAAADTSQPAAATTPPKDIPNDISNIFGGGELL